MSHPIRLFFEILGSLTALLLVGTGLLLWRLTAGPILVPFVTPVLEATLAHDRNGIRIDVGATWIDWSDRSRSIQLRITDTRVVAADGREIARIPEAWMSLAARRLLAGEIQPEELRVDGLRIALSRDEASTLRIVESANAQEPTEGSAGIAAFIVGELNGPPDPDRPLGLLASATFVDMTVTVDDAVSGLRLAAERASVRLRRDQRGVALAAILPVRLADQQVLAEVEALYVPQNEAVDFDARLRGISVGGLATLDPRLAALRGIEAVADLQVWTRVMTDGRVEGTHLTLDSSAGRIANPALFARPVELRALSLRARLSDDISRIDVDEAFVDFGGPAIRMSATLDDLRGRPRLVARADLAGFATADVQRLWPVAAATNARGWVLANLADGRVPTAHAEANLRADGPDWSKVAVERARLDFTVEGASVRYIEGLPPVRGVAGTATLDPRRFEIKTRGGAIGALKVEDGTIVMTGLDNGREQAAIDLRIQGPTVEALRLIDMKPLGFLGRIGESPESFGGAADVRLSIRFPLLRTLRLDQVEVVANAKVAGFTQLRAVLGQPIEDGTVDVKVDERGIDVRGDVRLAGSPAEIVYRREFAAGVEPVERASARGRADVAAQRLLGFDFAPYAVGPVGIDLTTQSFRDGKRDIALDLDLGAVAFAAPEIDWSRAAGGNLRARLRLALQDEVLRTLDVTDFSGGDMALRGRVEFAPDGKLWRDVNLTRVVLPGRIDLAEFRARRETASAGERPRQSLVARGAFLDAAPFLADRSKPDPDRPDLAVRLDVARFRMGEERELAAMKLQARRGPKRWERVQLDATTMPTASFAGGGALRVDLDVTAGGTGKLDAVAEDAGALLGLLEITPNVVGGALRVAGTVDPARADRAVVGKMSIENFRVVKAPGFARLLSVALLTGIVDSLRGEGIGFQRFDADFAWADPKIELRDGRMYGSALGVTARGIMDLDEDTLDIDGTLVPAYAVNSILGNIPLLGQLLVGERGSGVFAATYRASGALGDPQIGVNPLSTLAPGFLRRLFGVFGGSGPALPGDVPPELPVDPNR
jgi:hypothetical protein